MIEDIGKVIKRNGDKAYITVERSYLCKECGLKDIEGIMPGGKLVFEAVNLARASVGDKVKVRVQPRTNTKVFALFFGIPFLFLMTGAAVGVYVGGMFGRSSDLMSALCGLCGLIIGILALLPFRKIASKKKYLPVIIEVLGKNGRS